MKKIITIAGIFFLILVTAVIAGRVTESSPQFCGSCHEMKAAYEGWQESGAASKHENCIMCHSGSGVTGVIAAQFEGTKMLIRHFSGVAEAEENVEGSHEKNYVPDSFCIKCHDKDEMLHEHEVKHSINRNGSLCAKCHTHTKGVKFFTDL